MIILHTYESYDTLIYYRQYKYRLALTNLLIQFPDIYLPIYTWYFQPIPAWKHIKSTDSHIIKEPINDNTSHL